LGIQPFQWHSNPKVENHRTWFSPLKWQGLGVYSISGHNITLHIYIEWGSQNGDLIFTNGIDARNDGRLITWVVLLGLPWIMIVRHSLGSESKKTRHRAGNNCTRKSNDDLWFGRYFTRALSL
jgi:hypothetical protein